MRRHAVGILSLILLGCAAVLLARFDDNSTRAAGSICLRLGLTLGAVWLALPQLVTISTRFPPRLLVALLVGAVILVARPRSFPVVVLIVALVAIIELVGWLLKPLPPQRKKTKR